MEEKVQPLIVPSILEHEAITGLSGNKPGGMRGMYIYDIIIELVKQVKYYK